MGTLHLTVGGSELYPNPNGNWEKWIGRTYRATPVLDPTDNESLTVTLDTGQFRKYDYLDSPVCRYRVRTQTLHHSLK